MTASQHAITWRRFGALLGGSAGPSIGYAGSWSQLGASGWHIWLLATLIGALLGAITYGAFMNDDAAIERPGIGFAAAFGGTVGLLSGAFTAFPIGSVLGSLAGGVAGASAALVWRLGGDWRQVTRYAVAFTTAVLCSLASIGLLV